jgi:hypothetical protein
VWVTAVGYNNTITMGGEPFQRFSVTWCHNFRAFP